jgi:hypothetical protein
VRVTEVEPIGNLALHHLGPFDNGTLTLPRRWVRNSPQRSSSLRVGDELAGKCSRHSGVAPTVKIAHTLEIWQVAARDAARIFGKARDAKTLRQSAAEASNLG